MKKKRANGIFADQSYIYLMDDKEIIIYHKSNHTICKVIKIMHPLRIESDLNNNFLIVLNTLHTIFVYSLEDFTLQFQVNLEKESNGFLYDNKNLMVYATSTDLDRKSFSILKINLQTQKILSKTFDRLSMLTPCFIDKKVCVMIEEEIGETIGEINILDIDIEDLNILQIKPTKYKIGPISRVNHLYCFDPVNGLYNFSDEKLYAYESLGIRTRSVQYVKYYNEQYYIFASRDTYVLSKDLKILYHFHNDSIEEWIMDMLLEEDEIVFIKNNGIKIVKKE